MMEGTYIKGPYGYPLRVYKITNWRIKMTKQTVDKTLTARDKTHGNFRQQAMTAQYLKDFLHGIDGWKHLTPDQRESLETILTKISRILHGDPNHADSWHDIAGYARLIERRLSGE